MIYRDADQVLVRETFREADGTLSIGTTQPGRAAILERNARARIEKPLRDVAGLGRMVANIPFVDRARLHVDWPELDSYDAETRRCAWARFFASPESAPFKV